MVYLEGRGRPIQTECSADLFGFAPVEGRAVAAAFDGGAMPRKPVRCCSALRRACSADRALCRLLHRSPGGRSGRSAVAGLVGQRVSGIALGYENLIDHDQLRAMTRSWRCWAASLKQSVRIARRWSASRRSTGWNRASWSRSAIIRSAMTRRRSKPCLSTCFSMPMRRRRRSPSTSTPPTTHCTGIRKSVSSTAITTITATCRSMCSAAGICWLPNCTRPTSMPVPAASRRSHR